MDTLFDNSHGCSISKIYPRLWCYSLLFFKVWAQFEHAQLVSYGRKDNYVTIFFLDGLPNFLGDGAPLASRSSEIKVT